MTKAVATPSQLREQGREAFRLFRYYAHNPYAPRINDICAYENWLEGFLQEQYAVEWVGRASEALQLIADIAEGSRTVNSLPHIAKIARGALSPDRNGD